MRGARIATMYAIAFCCTSIGIPEPTMVCGRGTGRSGMTRGRAPPSLPASSADATPASEPGRVRCTVEAHTEEGRTMAWADVELVSLPEFATALKGRIGRDDSTARDATSAKWAFGLVAKKTGQGELRARVRVVVCTPPG